MKPLFPFIFLLGLTGCNSRQVRTKHQIEINSSKIEQNEQTIKIQSYRLNEKPGVIGETERIGLAHSIDSLKMANDSLSRENEKLKKQ